MSDLEAHHYGVTVSDLERAVEFYRDVLGLELLARFSVSGEAFATGVGVAGATGSFAHLDAGGSRLELVEYAPEGDEVDAAAVNRPGAKHLGFASEDVDEVYGSLPPDVPTVSEPRTTASGTRICFLEDPEGNLVELIET